MQFYNNRINKELDSLEEEFINLEVYLTSIIYSDFNLYLKSGNLKSYEEFKSKIKIDLSNATIKANEIVDKFAEKNDIELEDQMNKMGKQKISIIERKLVDLKSELELYGEKIIYEN